MGNTPHRGLFTGKPFAVLKVGRVLAKQLIQISHSVVAKLELGIHAEPGWATSETGQRVPAIRATTRMSCPIHEASVLALMKLAAPDIFSWQSTGTNPEGKIGHSTNKSADRIDLEAMANNCTASLSNGTRSHRGHLATNLLRRRNRLKTRRPHRRLGYGKRSWR